MITSRQALTVRHQKTADNARERLLSDRVMRHHRTPGAQPAAPAITVTFPSLSAGLQLARDLGCLSPTEQKRRAVQIARGFKSHYLSELSYNSASGLAVALLRPARPGVDIPRWISVTSEGDIRVWEEELDQASAHGRSRAVLLMTLSLLTVVFSVCGFALL
jgi:hypothetical protein